MNAKHKYLVPRERKYDFNPVYWNAVLQTGSMMKALYEVSLSIEWNTFNEGKMQSIMLQDDWDSVGEHIAERMISEKGYFSKLEKAAKKAENEILSFLAKAKKIDYTKLSLDESVKLANEIYSLFMKYDAATVPAWFIAGDLFRQKVQAVLGLGDEEFNIISLPEKKTFASQMDEDLLKSALKEDIKSEARKLSEKYYWVPFGYDGPEIWDINYFENNILRLKKDIASIKRELEELKSKNALLKEQRNSIMNKISRITQANELVRMLHTITLWTDERKMIDFQLFYQYSNALKQVNSLSGLSYGQLKVMTIEEISSIKKISVDIVNSRLKKGFMTVTKSGKLEFCSDEEYQKMKKELEAQMSSEEIRGTVASKGPKEKYVAKVKVVLSPEECLKVEEGDLLVASMTTPEYVVSMKKAVGFVTDEGGVTCHAAIVARELNKPCIIGTKIATKVLKDGDIVEVDAEKGVVRKV